ncbi:MAG: hypothetical protein ACOH1T_09440 [Microbacteriaceae bacterium]
MIDVSAHHMFAPLDETNRRSWSESDGDFDTDVSSFDEVEAFLVRGELVVRARTRLDVLSFYWESDPDEIPALIAADAEHIWSFLDGLPGVEFDRDQNDWQRFDIWVDVSPATLNAPVDTVYDVLDLVENHPNGAAFAELLEVRPGGKVMAFWDDLRAHRDAQRDDVGSIPNPGAADSGPV